MSTSAHIERSQMAGLAALDASDASRRAALDHVAECEACRDTWNEAVAVLDMLDAMPEPPPPTAEVLARIAKPIANELASARAAAASPPAFVVIAAVGMVWLAIAALGRGHLSDLPSTLVSLAVAVCAGVLAAVGTGRRSVGVAGPVAIGLSLVFALLESGGGGLLGRLGVDCMSFELGGAVVPLAVTAWLAARGRGIPSAGRYAAAAGAGALAAHGALHLSCAGHHATEHLLAFHVGGVLVAALVGAGLARWHGARLLGARRDEPNV